MHRVGRMIPSWLRSSMIAFCNKWFRHRWNKHHTVQISKSSTNQMSFYTNKTILIQHTQSPVIFAFRITISSRSFRAFSFQRTSISQRSMPFSTFLIRTSHSILIISGRAFLWSENCIAMQATFVKLFFFFLDFNMDSATNYWHWCFIRFCARLFRFLIYKLWFMYRLIEKTL